MTWSQLAIAAIIIDIEPSQTSMMKLTIKEQRRLKRCKDNVVLSTILRRCSDVFITTLFYKQYNDVVLTSY